MKLKTVLWLSILGTLLLTVAGVAQDAAVNQTDAKLTGPSRKLSGPVRSSEEHGTESKLPKSIVLRQVDGEIKIEASAEAATPSDAISFSSSYEGESWQVGSGPPSLAAASRAIGGNAPASEIVSVASSTISLDQLLGQSVFRGKSFLTPAPSSHLLSGKVTIRRLVDGESKLDADTIEILSGNETVVSFLFPENKDTMAWEDISGLPESVKDGLQAGEYSIRMAGQAGTTFVIEEEALAKWIREPMDQFAVRVGKDSPSNLVYSVEYLMSQTDENGRPAPYLCDALDLIDHAKLQTPYAKSRRSLILTSLGQTAESAADASQTGIAEIDALRVLIRDGRWSLAKEQAAELAQSDDPRTAGLARLYLAVITGESMIASIYRDDPAVDAFEQAIRSINTEIAADAFRAHMNYANYLSSKVQSRIYNYALQSATELESPLLTSLWQWNQAREQYALADLFGEKMPKSDQAAAAINQARLYVIMGDFVRNLRSQDEYSRKIISTADEIASNFATKTVALSDDEPAIRGAALEVLTHIAYRQGSIEAAEKTAKQALSAYELVGSLSGIESCYRTLGLIASLGGDDNADQAINRFEVSLQLSELLRSQVELSESGSDRAGFFARHAYTNERLIDLLVSKGDVTRALEVAEMAKARSFQDLLVQQRTSDDQDAEEPFVTLAEALENWPAETCAVEFFIGSRYAYAFCVLPGGEVSAHRIVAADGNPVAASELVGRVSQFLSSIELRARKMYREAVSGRGFDKSWQDDLHRFYLELIPEELRSALGGCQHLVIIPHHVLHYFPFAALVTEPDKAERGTMELPQPTFLIERPIDITVAPSLLTYTYLTETPSIVETANAVGIADFENAPRLAGVEQDLRNFQEVFGDTVGTIVQQKPITEPKITTLLGQPGLLLIGTHGQNEADRPLASFLLCNADPEFDGRLTALELFQLPIAADVVVLSACYSGLADRSPLPGDDLFGLQRALLQSGAKSIISGLWDVYDDTAPELIKSAMTHFAEGESISRGLADAQRDFLQKRKQAGPGDPWIHPYFWAVYNCCGGGHTTIRTR